MEKFVLQIINKGEKWTDPDFPPQFSSLYDRKIDRQADAKLFQSLSWKRFRDIYK